MPVISRTGEVLGGLFFGHSQAGVFTERAERLVAGIAGQAAVAMDGVRLLAAERAARAEAEAAVKARDEFLSIASHELRNPVAAVKVATQTLQRVLAQPAPDTARVARLVPGIATAADRLAGLLDDLLDVSRLRTGQLQLRRRPMDLAALVRQAVATQTQAGQAMQLQLELLCDPCELTGDPDRVAQVLENLLSNAAKYTPDGGAVLVRLERRADEAWLLVRDHGIGLPAGAAETIFEPFGRAENARTRNVPGLGLGLYICRQIVGSHGGRIWAESAGEGAGTSFWVVLPFQPQSALERAGDG